MRSRCRHLSRTLDVGEHLRRVRKFVAGIQSENAVAL